MAISDSLLGDLFSTPAMNAVFSPDAQLHAMVRFECALSASLEEVGIAPAGSADAIQHLLDARTEIFDPDRLRAEAAMAGNIAIPFVKQLTAAVAAVNAQAADFIHTGATSQDVLDTAFLLQAHSALELLSGDLEAALAQCVALSDKHTATMMAGRTWLQQGPPITFGLKAAGWAAALSRHRERLAQMGPRLFVLQFGGAVGTLASLGEHGARVSAGIARRLDLAEPSMPWHTHRDSLAELASVLGLLTGTLGKIGRDISLLMQSEVAEALEPNAPGRGSSSTMPHKRNPVGSAVALAAAVRVPPLVATMLAAMVQEHERGLGGWHAEWETLPEIFRLTAGALAWIKEVLEGLEVRPETMLRQLATGYGLPQTEAVSTALAATMGRARAHDLIEEASRRAIEEGLPLLRVLESMAEVTIRLTPDRLAALLDPKNYLGISVQFVSRTLNTISVKKMG